jgi:histidine triad (HIT) family protein
VSALSNHSRLLYSSSACSLARRLSLNHRPSTCADLATSATVVARRMASTNDEVAKAAAAAEAAIPETTVFDKILSGEWGSDKVHEDDLCLAFRDVNPVAPFHALVIPKQKNGLYGIKYANAGQHQSLLGHLMIVAGKVGKEHCPNGFRLVINDGAEGSQSVYHLHIHVIGGRQLSWPPG